MKKLEVVAVVVVMVLAILASAVAELATHPVTVTVSTTRTATVTQLNGASGVIEEVIVQPEVINLICPAEHTENSTSTAYLMAASNGGLRATSTTTTETLIAVSTVTIYENVTMVGSGTTCTDINPHYGVRSACPPCV